MATRQKIIVDLAELFAQNIDTNEKINEINLEIKRIRQYSHFHALDGKPTKVFDENEKEVKAFCIFNNNHLLPKTIRFDKKSTIDNYVEFLRKINPNNYAKFEELTSIGFCVKPITIIFNEEKEIGE